MLDALYNCYELLRSDPNCDIPSMGYSVAKVHFAFNLSKEGDLLDVVPLGEQRGKRIVPMEMEVPEQGKRTSGIRANFLCDGSSYILGLDMDNPVRALQAFEASKELHLSILEQVDDPGARAVCMYFKNWSPQYAPKYPVLQAVLDEVLDGGNIVFRLDGEPGYIHERPKVRTAWIKYKQRTSSKVVAQCLVTGEIGPIARLHPSIKGVRGAQSSGASLVSFNLNAFESYGKKQGFNAPVSEEVAFGYTTALNYMLSNRQYSIQLEPGTTVVFWSERGGDSLEQDLLAQLLFARDDATNRQLPDGNQIDRQTTKLIHDILVRVRAGASLELEALDVDLNSRFYILGLSPNASRLSVRFWHVDTFGTLLTRVLQHHQDMEIERPRSLPEYFVLPVNRILQETAPPTDRERTPPPVLTGGLMRAVLQGTPYPQSLYSMMLSRIRADMKVNFVRAAVIKACLLRRQRIISSSYNREEKGVYITVGLNQECTDTAYLLGRLFAVLEKAQQEANPNLSATIRDRFFGSASATPRAVFPQLLRLAQHHIEKAEYGTLLDRRIEEIMVKLDDFPSHLSLSEQGMFMLGYYHQREAFYKPSEGKEGGK
ncbi:MAG TPA: type I-C CRISPR-associated protein Cas8c/Csd1 [Firmicutes bacterium]|nr:type I-C CRISPR-associated protein Cas8c/Csd1 [Bacillota bacterium]